jgi:hypothetical protein
LRAIFRQSNAQKTQAYFVYVKFSKEALIQSTCADCCQIFSLARREIAGILAVFQDFTTQPGEKDGGKMRAGIESVVPSAKLWRKRAAKRRRRYCVGLPQKRGDT